MNLMDLAEENLHEILVKDFKEAVVFADAERRIRIFNRSAEAFFEIGAKRVLVRYLTLA